MVAKEIEEIRAQRHDFIKQYYAMATSDLDRHLKAGWQTIVVLAGGAAILTAGHDGKIGLPISTMIALITSFWGALTVIDANFWSLRAIGFLANVESVYLSVEDRKNFNPYLGFHPPYKLLNSLQYMFWLCLLFGAATFINFIWEISADALSLSLIWEHIEKLSILRRLMWCLPIFTALWGVFWTTKVWRNRLKEYADFSENCPGPGIRRDSKQLRHVTFEPVTGQQYPALESDSQLSMISNLRIRCNVLDRRIFWLKWFVSVSTLLIVIVSVTN